MRRLIFAGMLISFASCEPGDLVNLPSEPRRITILSENRVGDPWLIIVAPSKLPTESQFGYPGLPDAVVKIYEDGDFVEQLEHDTIFRDHEPSVFRSKISSPRPGHEYMITVEAEGFTTATAKYYQPEPVPADITFTLREKKPRVDVTHITDGSSNWIEYDTVTQWTFDISVTFTDPPGENFYDFEIASAPSEDSLYIPHLTQTDFLGVEDQRIQDQIFGQLRNDQDISGKRVTLNFIYNVDNDLGYIFEDYPLLNRKIPSWFKVSLITMNEAQYRFNIQSRKSLISNNDPYAQPVTTYTNVENGLGVFGAYTPYSKAFYYKLDAPED